MFFIIFLFTLTIIIALYYHSSRSFDYWSKRNIKNEAAIPIFGNHLRFALGLRNLVLTSTELYNKYPNELAVGYFRGSTPELIVRDPDIIKHILCTDFDNFYQRGSGRDIRNEPLLRNIVSSDDDLWKLLRQMQTPAFTISRIKAMFSLVIKCTEKIEVLGDDIVSKGGECDMRDFMSRFSTDFICACGFGIETDVIKNNDSFFSKIGKKIFKRSTKQVFALALWDLFPRIRSMVKVIDDNTEKAISDLVMRILKQRNYKPSGRHDFIDLLLELSTKEKIVGKSMEHKNPDGTAKDVELEINEELLTAQVFMFFGAGFETSASSTSATLNNLAHYPDIQRQIQEEIDEVLLKYNGKLCYNSIAEMTLLDQAFNESLRMFPPTGCLTRMCTGKTTIPKLDITLDPGVKIIVPLQALHQDERYYNDPYTFNPGRFTPDENKRRHKYVYLPYGAGPRACIGARLGHMQSLAGLAAVLRKFSVEPTGKSEKILTVNPRLNVVQAPLNGIPLKLKLRERK